MNYLSQSYLHLSLFYNQLPVGISTNILQGVGHVTLNHLLHLQHKVGGGNKVGFI